MSSYSTMSQKEKLEYQIEYYGECAQKYAVKSNAFLKIENVVSKIEEEIEQCSECYEIFMAKNEHSPQNTMMGEYRKEKLRTLTRKLERLQNGDLSIQREYIRNFDNLANHGNKKNKELTKKLVDLMEEVTQNFDTHLDDVCDTIDKSTLSRKRKRREIDSDDIEGELDSAPKRRKL
jgi:DNA repair ATPase RecN